MTPTDNDPHQNHDHEHVQIESAELKEYIMHNIKHLEEHVKSFKKLFDKIEDKHAIQALKNAITHLQKGLDELNHLFHHI